MQLLEVGCITRIQTRPVVTAQAGEHSPGSLERLPYRRPHATQGRAAG